MSPQLTLHTPGSQSLVLSLDNSDLEELSALLDSVSVDSKFYCIKQELEKIHD